MNSQQAPFGSDPAHLCQIFKGTLCVCLSMSMIYLQVSRESASRHRQALLTAMQERLYRHPIQRLEPLPINMSSR